jgi:hypothetical protein
MTPLPVQITNQTDWWQPYVPPLVGLLGSILVAVVALYSVRKSNGTNERAIDTADERERERWKIDNDRERERWQSDRDREREKWHRDNLLRICSEAVRVSRDISHHYGQAGAACIGTSDLARAESEFRLHMDAAQAAIGKVAPLSYDMQLLGETGLYMEFQEVRQAGEYVAPAFEQFHRYLVANHARFRAPAGSVLMAEAIRAELYQSMEWRRYYKAGQHLSQVNLDFQFAAQRKISPESLPKDAPERVDPAITPDKHPDLFYRPPGASQNIYQRPSPFDWNAGDTADPAPEPPNSPAA